MRQSLTATLMGAGGSWRLEPGKAELTAFSTWHGRVPPSETMRARAGRLPVTGASSGDGTFGFSDFNGYANFGGFS